MRRISRKLILIFFFFTFIISYNIVDLISEKRNIDTIEDEFPEIIPSINKSQDAYSTDIEYLEEDSATSITINSNLKNMIVSLLISLILVLCSSILFQYFVISSELREYIITAMKLSGFNYDIPKFSRYIHIDKLTIIITGFIKTSAILTAPYFDNFLEFGLTRKKESVTVSCDIEQLPLSLVLFYEYFQSNGYQNK